MQDRVGRVPGQPDPGDRRCRARGPRPERRRSPAQRRGRWQVVLDSGYNRRITGYHPNRAHRPGRRQSPLTITNADPTGTEVIGTLNNCAGGTTPWGTVSDRRGELQPVLRQRRRPGAGDPVTAIHARFGLPGGASERQWEKLLRPLRPRGRAERANPLRLGRSRSIRSIPPPPRRSAPRLAAPSTRATPRWCPPPAMS